MNPWEDGDGVPPILVLADGGALEYGVEDFPPALTENAILANWRTMLQNLQYPGTWRGLRAFRHAYSEGCILLALEEEHSQQVSALAPGDRLDAYVEMYGWLGIPAYAGVARGPCQRDHANVLAVGDGDLKAAVELWAAYAFGNVWGFIVTQECGQAKEVESCYGFYGDPETSGAIEEAEYFSREVVA